MLTQGCLPGSTMTDSEEILDKALSMGLRLGWEKLTLRTLAEECQLSLMQLYPYFSSKDALSEALFTRADLAMLSFGDAPQVLSMHSDERLVAVLMSWFDTLLPYKPLLKPMLGYKLEPGHIHLQAQGIVRISRTVQWCREAAGRRHVGWRKVVDEVGVTTFYLSGMLHFLRDKSQDNDETRALLLRQSRLLKTRPGWG